MKTKKIPMRSCVVSHEKLPKSELIRIVRMPDGNVVVDNTGKINGKGAYIKKDITVLDKAKKSKILDKMLDVELNDNIYDKISEIVNN